MTKKKTWIKVKRGILEPKHIAALGQAWYLYLYILDNADWETGKIVDWKDKYAADELGKPLGMIREHRKILEGEYISSTKNRYSQTITIHNWTNPRMYDGKEINKQGSLKAEPSPAEENESEPQSNAQSEPQSILDPSVILDPSYNHISHITCHNKELIKPYFAIWDRETNTPIKDTKKAADLFTEFIAGGIDVGKWCEAIRGQMADGRYKVLTPASVKKWAMNGKKGKAPLDGAAYRASWKKLLGV